MASTSTPRSAAAVTARAVLGQLSASGRLVALDRDAVAVASAADDESLAADPRFAIVHTAFSAMASTLDGLGIAQVSGVLLDLGVSSPQIDDPARGFSFRFDGPLDMRMRHEPGREAPRNSWPGPTSGTLRR